MILLIIKYHICTIILLNTILKLKIEMFVLKWKYEKNVVVHVFFQNHKLVLEKLIIVTILIVKVNN